MFVTEDKYDGVDQKLDKVERTTDIGNSLVGNLCEYIDAIVIEENRREAAKRLLKKIVWNWVDEHQPK